MARPKYHIFVCTQKRAPGHPRGSCASNNSEAVFNAFAQSLMQKQLFGQIAITSTGCIGPCQTGANVLVYPEGVMYGNVSVNDVENIIQQHLIDGQPVAEKFVPAEVW